MEDRLVDVVEAAKILGLRVATMNAWRWLKKGPVYYRMGNRVLYKVSDLKAFF